MKHILSFSEFLNEELLNEGKLTQFDITQVKSIDLQIRKALKGGEIKGSPSMISAFSKLEKDETVWHIDATKNLSELLVNYWIIDESARIEASKTFAQNVYILCNYDAKTGTISNPRGEEAWKHSRSEMNRWSQVWHNSDKKKI
jgi:hypothetical protein